MRRRGDIHMPDVSSLVRVGIYYTLLQKQDTTRPTEHLIAFGTMAIRHLQPFLHLIRTGELLALAPQRFGVDAVDFANRIHLVGIKPRHTHTRQMVIHEALGLPPEEHGLILFLIDIHQRGKTRLVKRTLQAIDVTQLTVRWGGSAYILQ